MGTLRVKGTIDLDQFWPKGDSDADTTKILLQVNLSAFEYKKDGAATFKKTKVFSDAISRGQGSKPVITTRKKDNVQFITVRLQGVDAPELHYKAAPLKGSSPATAAERKKYNDINREEKRQHFAESATAALAAHLKKFATNGKLKASFESSVDKPFEVVDTYGRFIGNIIVGNNEDINLWLVENGWCSPAFYTSMSEPEIQTFLTAWKKGKKKTGRTGSSISKDASTFDFKLVYRKPKTVITPFKIGDDKGKSIMPKIFRRQVAWQVSKKAKIISSGTSFKAQLKKTPDPLILLADFLSQGFSAAPIHALHEFVSATNKIAKDPEELIFQEKPGTLVNKNGKKIVDW